MGRHECREDGKNLTDLGGIDLIPYGRQDISSCDIDAVVNTLKSDFLTQGPQVPLFEEEMAAYCGAAHAVAVNSATSALHIACMALDVGPGDLVWTSPITFVASANCARYCGADVDFVDIDPATYNMDPVSLETKLRKAAEVDRLPKVVIPVHLSGQSCDMSAIHELGRQYGFSIIEDASHAVGGRYKDLPVGSCRYSEITIFSFHPVKIITTGEGGMALTNRSGLASRMAMLRSHGITRDTDLFDGSPDGPWSYQQLELGYNYRMTDIQAALGRSQLMRLDDFVAARNALSDEYDARLADLPVVTPYQLADSYSARHLYIIRLKLSKMVRSRKEVFEELRSRGVGVNIHYIPVHLQPYYRKRGFGEGDCPAAEQYYSESITIPLFHHMTDEQQATVSDVLHDILHL